jgi:hypothetical protein
MIKSIYYLQDELKMLEERLKLIKLIKKTDNIIAQKALLASCKDINNKINKIHILILERDKEGINGKV